MSYRLRRFATAIFWISIFCLAGFALVRLVFWGLCRFGGHYTFEHLAGLTTPVILGIVIGIESFLWWRERQTPRR